jgi:hypothetical protein
LFFDHGDRSLFELLLFFRQISLQGAFLHLGEATMLEVAVDDIDVFACDFLLLFELYLKP